MAFLLTRKFNRISIALDSMICLLSGKFIDGTEYTEDVVQLKQDIVTNKVNFDSKNTELETYQAKHPTITSLETYTDKTGYQFSTDITNLKDKATALITDTEKSKTFAVLKNKASMHKNTTALCSPVPYYQSPYFWANSINDLLDAASYTLRGINSDNGESLGCTEDQIEARVHNYLNQIPGLVELYYPSDITDVDSMGAVAAFALSQLGIYSSEILAQYIDDNVEKLPTMMRNWA